ncbi:Beta-lactamase superfamily domain [Carpediemonas membranifera]|uniref:ribonuclease Z n=1 Tax=Carpediemonas membranifera TaxID=201153 RepID=A0A8J6B183_9EUKA|nr:Beta-lactamase superfamily domain [Carpediemonas membranifera]|eukprot:KAG9390764.1 Beta-lactamase superfamily domain [Carpediemonas membranifera]
MDISPSPGDDSFILYDEQDPAILINAPGSAQRTLLESGVRIRRLQAVILTDMTPTHVEGLPGALFTFHDTVTAHFPDRTLPVYTADTEDPRMTHINGIMQHMVVWRALEPRFVVDPVVMHYRIVGDTKLVCAEFPELPPKFDGLKAKSLGVKGILCRELAQGRSVVVNGTTVEPHQVLSDVRPGGVLVIALCKDKVDPATIEAVAEYSPTVAVFSTDQPGPAPAIQGCKCFMRWRYGAHPVGLRYPTVQAIKTYHSDRFLTPRLYLGAESISTIHTESIISMQDRTVTPAPSRVLSSEVIQEYATKRTLTLDRITPRPSPLQDGSQSGTPSVIFLGTSAMMPVAERNVTSILLRASGGSVLFDCGEGTWRQMLMASLGDEITRLQAVVITHSHANHTVGLTRLVYERTKAGATTPLFLACDNLVWSFFSSILGSTVTRVNSVGLCRSAGDFGLPDGIECLKTFPVPHIPDSSGIRVDLPDFSFAFSGDTPPTPTLIEACSGVNLLIHEATFPGGSADRDENTKLGLQAHSTAVEAVTAGKECGCQWVVLTHFSGQVSAHLTRGLLKDIGPKVIVAGDLLALPLDMAWLCELEKAMEPLDRVWATARAPKR